MGYYINQRDASFTIKKENYAPCLEAIKKLGDGDWVDGDKTKEAKTLKEAFEEWRWEVDEDDSGITHIRFNGEKSGSDEKLFREIAPYVESGSYIEMQGEEGEIWQWQFNDGKNMDEVGAVLDWEGNGEIINKLLKKKALLPLLLGIDSRLDERIGKTLKKKSK